MAYGTRSKSKAAAATCSTSINPAPAAAPTTSDTKKAPAVKKGGVRKHTKSTTKKPTGKQEEAAVTDALEDAAMEDAATESAAADTTITDPATAKPVAAPKITYPKRKPPVKKIRNDEWPEASLPGSPIGPDDLDPDVDLTVSTSALQERDELDYTAIVKTLLAEEAAAAAVGAEEESAEWNHAEEKREEAMWARYSAKLASIAVRNNAQQPKLRSLSEAREWYVAEDARRVARDIEEAARRLEAELVARQLEEEEAERQQEAEEAALRQEEEEAAQQQVKGKGRAADYEPEASDSRKRKRRDFEEDTADDQNKRSRTGEPVSRPAEPASEASGSRKRKAGDRDDQTDQESAARPQPGRQSKRIRLKNTADNTIAAVANTIAAAPNTTTAAPDTTAAAPNAIAAAANTTAATNNNAATAAQPNEAVPPRQRVLCGVAGCNNSANSVSELRKHYKVKHGGVAVPQNKQGLQLVDFIEWLNDRIAGYPPTEQAKKRYPSKIERPSAPLSLTAPTTTSAGPGHTTDPTPATAEEGTTAGPSQVADPIPAPEVPVVAAPNRPRPRRAAKNPIENVLRKIEKEGQSRLDMVAKGGLKGADNSLQDFMANEEYPAWIRRAIHESVGSAPRLQGGNLVDQKYLLQVQRVRDQQEDRIEELERENEEQAKELEEAKKEIEELRKTLGK